ncbi:MAG: hypothetical protein DRR04_10380 [Gammaproteobacteria bacterium]|nr:MAG: hypothetical protein DRR04_10380 [Gammaproteobacteria bacterium]
MKPPMLHTAYKVSSSRNAYGDYVAGAETTLICHWRDITNLIQEANEQIQSDAMAWFEPDSGVVKGDIIKFEGNHYVAIRITRARKLRETPVQFLKVELQKYGAIS